MFRKQPSIYSILLGELHGEKEPAMPMTFLQ